MNPSSTTAAAKPVTITPVQSAAETAAFIDLAYRLNAHDPHWVPPLRSEVKELITPGGNPWFTHGHAQFFLAHRDGRVVGRISAHIDALALTQPVEQGFGPGTGFWGLFEAEDEAIAAALLDAAEAWLVAEGMTRMIGPVSLSMWDEPGLLIQGHDTPPTVMLGHNSAAYQPWVEARGHVCAQDLYNFRLPIADGLPPIVNRLVEMMEKGGRVRIRKVDTRRFDEEAALIAHILNDAWSDNWGFVPWTAEEIAYAGKKLKPIVYPELIRIAELDGEPVAFMMVLPDLNERLRDFGGRLFPFNWAKLLWWLRAPKVKTMRVPLMGVLKRFHSSRTASQLAFSLIEYIRQDAVAKFGAVQGDFGWVLASNGPMRSVGEAVGGTVSRVYRIYEKRIATD